MTEAVFSNGGGASLWHRLYYGKTIPVLMMLIGLTVIWYAGAVYLNKDTLISGYERNDVTWDTHKLIEDAWAMERPILPAPHQIAVEINKTVFQKKITSKRSLIYHAWITTSATLLGFGLGTLLGVLLAVGIVHVQTLDRSLMPWIIASQTIPILAIAPMIIVVLGNLGITGTVPKSIISMYLCFFPIAIGMVKGLRSPDVLQLDLMQTYSASTTQIFWKLRVPASIPFLFASLKVAVAISLVGAIVGELPTGAVAGIGARLLSGSYYGQTIQIWSALIVASFLGMLLVYLVTVCEKFTLARMGERT
ncbi:MAG: ABC transporter permease [Sneathiella sp.]